MTGRWDGWHWQNGWFELGFQLGLGAIGRLSHNFHAIFEGCSLTRVSGLIHYTTQKDTMS